MCLLICSIFTDEKFFSTDKKRKKSCQLLDYILDCLYKTFLYDTESFVNKERFDIIMQPLVDQVFVTTVYQTFYICTVLYTSWIVYTRPSFMILRVLSTRRDLT